MKSQQEMGNAGRFRGVKCVALPQLEQLVEAGDGDDTGGRGSKHKRGRTQKHVVFLARRKTRANVHTLVPS